MLYLFTSPDLVRDCVYFKKMAPSLHRDIKEVTWVDSLHRQIAFYLMLLSGLFLFILFYFKHDVFKTKFISIYYHMLKLLCLKNGSS